MNPLTRLPHVLSRPLGVSLLGVLLAVTMAAVPVFAATWDIDDVISDENFRGSYSMTQQEIQEFLNTQPGVLKSYSAPDYAGKVKPAAQIIYEAAVAWNVNPKVILATLEKEQSLIGVGVHAKTATHSHGTYEYHLPKAMGCGIFAGSTNTYPGFGNQVWNGARKLSTYEVTFGWKPGKTMLIVPDTGPTKITIVPQNAATFAQYTYTPHEHGVKLFWTIYERWFGDTHASPRLRPVYRFSSVKTGELLFTGSEYERASIRSRLGAIWRFEGAGFTADASSGVPTVPLYRMYNRANHSYFYVASAAEVNSVYLRSGRMARADAILCMVSPSSNASTTPVYRMYKKSTRSCLITTSVAERDRLIAARSGFKYDGIVGYLPLP